MAARRKKDESGFNRRTFLKTVGAGGVAVGVLSPSVADAQATNAVGPGAVPIQLTINGRAHKLEVEPRVTLLDALRDAAGHDRRQARMRPRDLRRVHGDHRGPHHLRVLDAGDRGAGQDHPDRRELDQRHGAASGAAGVLRPRRADVRLLHAWLRHVGRRARSRKIRSRPREQARKALDGNICRCGTYVRVLEAAWIRSHPRG